MGGCLRCCRYERGEFFLGSGSFRGTVKGVVKMYSNGCVFASALSMTKTSKFSSSFVRGKLTDLNLDLCYGIGKGYIVF